MPKVAKTRADTGDDGNRNGMRSSDSKVPIPPTETELFGERLRTVLGEDSIRAFAGRCGVSDGLIGAYLRGEKSPGLKHLVALAEAGGVTVDWLATGRPPRTRAELQRLAEASAQRASTRPTPDPDQSLLVKCLIAAEQALGRGAGAEARAALATQLLEAIPKLDDRVTGNLEMLLIAEDFTPIAQFLLLLERLDNQLYGDSDDD